MAASTTLTPEQRAERARKAGLTSHTPAVLAARIVATWPELDADQRAIVKTLLRPIINRRASCKTEAARHRRLP